MNIENEAGSGGSDDGAVESSFFCSKRIVSGMEDWKLVSITTELVRAAEKEGAREKQ